MRASKIWMEFIGIQEINNPKSCSEFESHKWQPTRGKEVIASFKVWPREIKKALFHFILHIQNSFDFIIVYVYIATHNIPTFSKIFKVMLKTKFLHFLERKNLFCENQYEYKKARFSTLTMVDLLEEVMQAFNDGDGYVLTYCYFAKAFDCVDHNLLLQKNVFL